MRKPLALGVVLPYILLIGGLIGIFCAGMLTYDKILLLTNPSAQAGCDLNPIVACGPVINKPQAAAFGFPNPFLGLVGFAVVATTGAVLLAGATLKRWYWWGMQAGVLFGAGFVTWLQYETIYHIGALCPYCMVTWVVMLPIFWYTTLHILREQYIKTPARWQPAINFAQKHHGDLLALWFALIATAIGTHFWYYWRTLF